METGTSGRRMLQGYKGASMYLGLGWSQGRLLEGLDLEWGKASQHQHY